ncbi:MAG: malate dehydrogenase [bacterium]|nr:malate dehydrogenase [bacterium]
MEKVNLDEASLAYHEKPVHGKIALKLTKKCETQEALSLAYSPGVAKPCTMIHENPQDVWKYTARGNLIAVVSDGTAVLGLGNIGPEAAMPVMEGKGVLFKRFADVDVFPICIQDVFTEDGKSDPKKIIETVKRLEPTFGGINLEDIAAPACFEIEQTLKKALSIPVFHDDQHGTAIISLAGLINALKIVGKKIEDCKFVVNGAGAAGIACAEYYIKAGAKRENFVLCDSKGVLDKTRENLNPEKQHFADAACTSAKTLKEAMVNADIFIGVSVAGCVSKDMIRSMAKDSIIFPMANPIPEIYPDEALEAGAAVVGTGRSDFANQVNNVLGFPGIFRGALDTRATDINVEMYLGASKALADIASEKLPEDIYKVLSEAYPEDAAKGMFDGEKPLNNSYVIPKPFDPRVVPRVARNVAEAAMKTGVAQIQIKDLDAYEKQVSERIKNLLKTL